MNDKIEILVKEMLQYVDDSEKEIVLLKNAEKKLAKPILFMLIRDLLDWNNPFFIKIYNYNPKKMPHLSDERNIKYRDNMKSLFDQCPTFNDIFLINDDALVFKSEISVDEINEIRVFIEKNKLIKIQSKETRLKK